MHVLTELSACDTGFVFRIPASHCGALVGFPGEKAVDLGVPEATEDWAGAEDGFSVAFDARDGAANAVA